MSAPVYFTTLGLFLGTVLAIFAMRYYSANRQAKARLAQELDYRDIAAKAAVSQADTAAAITAILATLTEITTRLNSIDKVLKEVE